MMAPEVQNLKQIQGRMAAALMLPLTRSARPRIGRSRQSMAEEAAAFIKPNSRLTSLERLDIYSRSYWFRLVDR